ncbi:TonB-dependent receptor [Zhouia sp. PK063]|uniref:TonB-dependent receptor n=1 Tax=Zhouia sp. PK063 TaxID=3373602 RepID=UPI0037AC9F70
MKKLLNGKKRKFSGSNLSLKMKLTSLLLLISMFTMHANNGYAQKTKVTLNMHDVTVGKVIDEIETSTDFKFIFSTKDVDLKRKLSIQVNKEGIENVLNNLFQSTQTSYQVEDKNVYLKKSVNYSISASGLQAQEVEGVVKDEQGEPLLGVTVAVKGTTRGTTTDFDGHYKIDVTPGETLVFSYVGFASQEISVSKSSSLVNVTLIEQASKLQEVEVTVAYGKQKRISVVGAQTTVDADELKQPVSNITTVLAGRVSGLTGVQRSGLPGYDGADIWIRGLSTFASSAPLILVDGVERSMDNINPQDIASFTILKDASATAVYGVRGANGVILIETKRGKVGKPKVQVDYNEGITYFTKMPQLADGLTYMNLANEALRTRGQAPKYTQETIDRTASNYDPLLYPNVDWFSELFKDFGHNRLANVNASGGAEQAQYYVSLSYYDETGLFKTSDLEDYDSSTSFKRYNVTSNLTLDLTNTTKVNLGIQGYLSEGNYSFISPSDIFIQAMLVPPVEYPVMYPGGYVPGKSANGDLRNPYADLTKRGYTTENKNQLYSNLRITQDLSMLTDGLSITGMFAFDTYNQFNINQSKRESTYFVDETNPYNEDGTLNLQETYTGTNYLQYGRVNGGNRRFYLEASLNYDRSFGKHQVGGLLLFNRSDYVNAFADTFTDAIPYRNQGIALRGTYSYDNKYFVDLNAGYNGSENFAPDKRYGLFPSVAVGWVISNEDFFEPISKTINFLKLRYSDGIVGSSSGASRFAYLSRVEDGQNGYTFGENRNGIGGIAETYQGVDVTWVTARKQDLGLEINAFDSSLKLTIDAFKEKTDGAFLPRADVPNYIGLVSDPSGNIGKVENKGLDGTLSYTTSFNDFRFSARGTFSYNKNKILENGEPQQPYPWLNHRGDQLLTYYGYVAERLFTLADDKDGDGYITPTDGFPTQFGQIQPGDIKYKDLNGDGQIDAYDKQAIGNGDVPSLTVGLGLSGEYKGVDVALFFQGQKNADRIIDGSGIRPFNGDGGRGNLYSVATDRWTPENDNAYAMYPRLSYGSSGIGQNNNNQPSSWWVRNIDFVRLKTAEIGYTLPKSISDKVGFAQTRFYLRATNVFTISNFDLWDPELNTTNGGAYPNISVVSLGVNFQF